MVVQQGRSFSWVDDNETFDSQSSSLTLSLTKSRLYIDCLKPSDAGQYTCIAQTPTKRISRPTTVFAGQYIYKYVKEGKASTALIARVVNNTGKEYCNIQYQYQAKKVLPIPIPITP